MPTQFDALMLMYPLDVQPDDRPTRILAGAIVVLWALGSLVLWGVS
jgi:hypothetical protein